MYNTFEANTIKNTSNENVVVCRMVTDLKPSADIFKVKAGEKYLFTYITDPTDDNPATVSRLCGTITSLTEKLTGYWPSQFFAMVVGDHSDGVQSYEINTKNDVLFNLGTAAESITAKHTKAKVTTDVTINKATYVAKMGSAYSTLNLSAVATNGVAITDTASALTTEDKAYITKYLSDKDITSAGSYSYTYKNGAAIVSLRRPTTNSITVNPTTFLAKAGTGSHTIVAHTNSISYSAIPNTALVTITSFSPTALMLSKFGTNTGYLGMVKLIYNGSNWELNSSSIDPTTLGLVISGTATINDYICLYQDYCVSYTVDDSTVSATEYGISCPKNVFEGDTVVVEVATKKGFVDADNVYAGFNSGLTGTYTVDSTTFSAVVSDSFNWVDSSNVVYTLSEYGITIPSTITVAENDTLAVEYIPAISTATTVSYTHLLKVPEKKS